MAFGSTCYSLYFYFYQNFQRMRKTLHIFFILFTLSSVAYAQHSTRTIIDDINTKKAGQGNVRVMQDETIDARLAVYTVNTDTANVIRLSNDRVNGFKIQVFSGNNQQKSRSEAERKQSLIRAEFPQHQAETTFVSPTWRLRVGNFMTRPEAEAVMVEMKKAFPEFGREMYIVSDIIRRPLNR